MWRVGRGIKAWSGVAWCDLASAVPPAHRPPRSMMDSAFLMGRAGGATLSRPSAKPNIYLYRCIYMWGISPRGIPWGGNVPGPPHGVPPGAPRGIPTGANGARLYEGSLRRGIHLGDARGSPRAIRATHEGSTQGIPRATLLSLGKLEDPPRTYQKASPSPIRVT